MMKRFLSLALCLLMLLPIRACTEGTMTVEEKVNEIIRTEIKPGMSDYTKAKVLHDYLMQHAQLESGYASYYEALLYGVGNSFSYATCYQALLEAVGIECRIVEGAATGALRHAWNLVRLDGDWYHVDCAMDDAYGARWDYFCLSDTAMKKDHTWSRFMPKAESDRLSPDPDDGALPSSNNADFTFATLEEFQPKFRELIEKPQKSAFTARCTAGQTMESPSWDAYSWLYDQANQHGSFGIINCYTFWDNYGEALYCELRWGDTADNYLIIDQKKFILDVGAVQDVTIQTLVPPDSKVTWSAANPAVAKVSNGRITAVSAGTTTVTATVPSGDSHSITVVVVGVHNPTFPLDILNADESTAYLSWTAVPGATEFRIYEGSRLLLTTSKPYAMLTGASACQGKQLHVVAARVADGKDLFAYTSDKATYGSQSFAVVIPAKVTSIEQDAFRDDVRITSLFIPNGVTTIGSWAFMGCKNLQVVYLPASITYMDAGVFGECPSMQFVIAEKGSYAESYIQYSYPEWTIINP